MYHRTPLAKCRTRRVGDNQKNIIQSPVKATISFEDISDETSTMEYDDDYISMSERSSPSELIDDVFTSRLIRQSESEKETHSSPETFRCSERHPDEWSRAFFDEEDSNDGSPNSDSEELQKKMLCSTGIHNPQIPAILAHFEEIDDISSVHCNEIISNEGESQHDPGRTPKKKFSKMYSGKKVFTKAKKKNSSKVKVKEALQKRNSLETPIRLKEIHAPNVSPPRKSKEALHQANNEDLWEELKTILSDKPSGDVTFQKNRETSEIRKIKQYTPKGNLAVLPSEFPEMSPNLLSVNVPSSNKCNEALPQTNNKDGVCETPKVIKDRKRKVLRKVLQREQRKTTTAVLSRKLKRKDTGEPSNKNVLKKNSNKSLTGTINSEHFVEQVHNTKPRKNTRSPLLRISEENAEMSLERNVTIGSKHSKKTVATKLTKRKKNPKLTTRNEDELENKIDASVTSLLSTEDFIESEESIDVSSLRNPGNSLNKSLEGIILHDHNAKKIAAPKLVERKKEPKANVSNEDSFEEEILSTPSSTIIEDSIEYMDTTESEKRTSSVSDMSTYKFLEEIGMLESDFSKSSGKAKLVKRKKNTRKKKNIDEDSWEKKSLSEKIREYKEYLNTVPICDLSLKKRLVKNQ